MRSADVVDKGRGIILLGVGLFFASLPVIVLAFATPGLGFAELEELDAFAETLTVVDVVIGGEVRGTLGFAELVLVVATSDPGFTEVVTFATLFPPGVFPAGC